MQIFKVIDPHSTTLAQLNMQLLAGNQYAYAAGLEAAAVLAPFIGGYLGWLTSQVSQPGEDLKRINPLQEQLREQDKAGVDLERNWMLNNTMEELCNTKSGYNHGRPSPDICYRYVRDPDSNGDGNFTSASDYIECVVTCKEYDRAEPDENGALPGQCDPGTY